MSQSKCLGGKRQDCSRNNSTSPQSEPPSDCNLALPCSFCRQRKAESTVDQIEDTEAITGLLQIVELQLGQDAGDMPPSVECLEEWRKLCSVCKEHITSIWEKKKLIDQLSLEISTDIENLQQTVAVGFQLSAIFGLPRTSTVRAPILRNHVTRRRKRKQLLFEPETQSSSAAGDSSQASMEVEQDLSDVDVDDEDAYIEVEDNVEVVSKNDSRKHEEDSFAEEGNVNKGGNIADDAPITGVVLPNQTVLNDAIHEGNLPGPSSAMQRLPAYLSEVNVLNSAQIDNSLADRGSVKNIKRKARSNDRLLKDEDKVVTVYEKRLTMYSPNKIVKRDVAPNSTKKQKISESHEGGTCLVCKQYFPKRKSLWKHKATHTEDEKKNFRESVKFRDNAPIFQDNRVRKRAETPYETERNSSSTAGNNLQTFQNSMEVEEATPEAEGGDKDADIQVDGRAEVVSLNELENMSENDSSISEECQDNLAENGNMNQEQNVAKDITNTDSDMTNRILENIEVDDENLTGPSSAIRGLRVSPSDIESSQQNISNGNSADATFVTTETVQIIKQEASAADAEPSNWNGEESEILTESEKRVKQAEQQKRKLKRQRIESYNGVKVVFCDGPGLNTNGYLQCSICSFIVCSPKKTVKWAGTPMLKMKQHISKKHKDGPGHKCLICEQHFPDTKSLRNHKATHSEEERKMGRESLKQRDTVSKLHKKPVLIPKDTSEEIACYVCYQLFPNIVACESHLVNHRKDILRNKYMS